MLKKKVIDEVGKVHCLRRCLGGSEERRQGGRWKITPAHQIWPRGYPTAASWQVRSD
jgi:hypothetical protein